MSYNEKENYIAVHPDPSVWKNHANYFIMQHYQDYIKGVCADFGCNHGACTLLLLEWTAKLEAIYGLDMNYEALQVAYHVANQMSPTLPINFMAVNLLEIPLGAELFDFIMTFHTLEHIYPQDVDSFVKEIHRTLKPGGHVLISIPYDHAYPDEAHVGFYKEPDMIQLFERHGFFVVECIKDDRWEQKDLLTGLFLKPQ